MKKSLQNILIGILVILGVLRLTGALTFYNISSTGTEPNLKLGSRFIGSNFVKPDRLDFGYYSFDDPQFGNIVIVQRLIGLPGDIIECKAGEFFVNGESVDQGINFRRFYKFHKDDYIQSMESYVKADESLDVIFLEKDTVAVSLDDDFVKSFDRKLERLVDNKSSVSKDINPENHDWNVNNFGPVKIPENSYFFVGDNRDNSMDSRSRGFINKEDVKGTLLFQF